MTGTACWADGEKLIERAADTTAGGTEHICPECGRVYGIVGGGGATDARVVYEIWSPVWHEGAGGG